MEEAYIQENVPVRRTPTSRLSRGGSDNGYRSEAKKRMAQSDMSNSTKREKVMRTPKDSADVPIIKQRHLNAPVYAPPKLTPSEMKEYLASMGFAEQGMLP